MDNGGNAPIHPGYVPQGLDSGDAATLVPIPSVEYQPLRKFSFPLERNRWTFTRYGGRPGVSLAKALLNEPTGLDGACDACLDVSGSKMRYCVAAHGYDMFFQQKNIHRVKNGVLQPITRHTLLRQTAEVVAMFIERASRTVVPNNPHAMRFGPGHVELKDLYLLEIRQCGATLQPQLGVLLQASSVHTTSAYIPADELGVLDDHLGMYFMGDGQEDAAYFFGPENPYHYPCYSSEVAAGSSSTEDAGTGPFGFM